MVLEGFQRHGMFMTEMASFMAFLRPICYYLQALCRVNCGGQ